MPSTVRILVVEVDRSALVLTNLAAGTQAAGGGAAVGEVAAQVRVEVARQPVRTRQQPSNDTQTTSRVLLDSPEVAIGAHASRHRRDGCIVVGGSGKVADL